MLLVLILFTFVCFSTQEVLDSTISCDGAKNCSEVATGCLKYYKDLEVYVTRSIVILEELKSVFFSTGEDPTKFVKLIYNFKVSNSTTNSVSHCSNQTATYIWSDSALYLLGPTLVWSTFFALDISGYRITIDLPCLCFDKYGELLSRLTYLSKVYAAMEYHDQPLQFISSHYFQLRNKDDVIYNAIVGIMMVITYLPVVMMPLISCLTIIHIYPSISHRVDQYSKFNQEDLKQFAKTDVEMSKLISFYRKWKKAHLFSLFFTSCVVTVLLVILHIFSAIHFITYGNKILDDDSHKLPYLYSVISCLLIGIMLTVAILISICRWGKSSLIGISISVNIVYIASYFVPPMVLAFIQDPMQVILTCLMATVVVAFVYGLVCGLGLLVLLIIQGIMPFSRWSYKTLINFVISFFTAFSLFFYFILIRCMFTLGSFSDFQSLQNMLLPLLVVLLSIFILKPGYKYVCKTMSGDVSTEKVNIRSHGDEVNITLDQRDSDTEIEEIDSQNDEDTIV